MSDECIGWWGKKFGHNYEARFDSEMPGSFEITRGSLSALEAMREKTYVKDVCTRCGKEILR